MRFYSFCLIFSSLLLLAACGDSRQEQAKPAHVIRLDKLDQLPSRKPASESNSFRVAVAAILSPEGTVDSYRPLTEYLEGVVGKPVHLIQRRTYQEINDLLARNVVDVAFICTGAYMEGSKKDILSLLVVPQIDGKTTYKAMIIVPARSGLHALGNLKGKTFAFTDPMSNTGYLYPLSLLASKGLQPESFFGRTIFTYSHDRSIAAVKENVADGASVDNLVYAYARKRDPEVAVRTKVIWESREFGMPPVVIPSQTSREKKDGLKKIFLGIHREKKGRRVLAVLGIDRFVEPDIGLYAF